MVYIDRIKSFSKKEDMLDFCLSARLDYDKKTKTTQRV